MSLNKSILIRLLQISVNFPSRKMSYMSSSTVYIVVSTVACDQDRQQCGWNVLWQYDGIMLGVKSTQNSLDHNVRKQTAQNNWPSNVDVDVDACAQYNELCDQSIFCMSYYNKRLAPANAALKTILSIVAFTLPETQRRLPLQSLAFYTQNNA